MVDAVQLNADCHAGKLNRVALQQAIRARGDRWADLVAERCPYLFSDTTLFISSVQLQQMHAVVAAVERVVRLPGWMETKPAIPVQRSSVFFGYDFHLDQQSAQLIEINTNAGGGFLNALLIGSQDEVDMPGKNPIQVGASSCATSGRTVVDLEQTFLEMFLCEWHSAMGDAPLSCIAIVDEDPEAQYLYPEFLLAKDLFERAGITAHVVSPEQLQAGANGVYLDKTKINLIYNRLTDFSLQRYPVLQQAYLHGQVVVTPHPYAYAQYADKRNLARLTDAQGLRALGVDSVDITTLQAGIPLTIVVQPEMAEMLWLERKQWFFKPVSGHGGKGAYRGANVTRRVFGEIMQGGYVAQKLAVPGERIVCAGEAEPVTLKADVRCYVYDGQMQLVAARLYQGQTTNLRTPGGGFSLVRMVE